LNKEILNKPEELIAFSKTVAEDISLTKDEAQAILDLHEGHNYIIGVLNNALVRLDMCDALLPFEAMAQLSDGEIDEFTFFKREEYSLFHAIDSASTWCSELAELQRVACEEEPDDNLEKEKFQSLLITDGLLNSAYSKIVQYL